MIPAPRVFTTDRGDRGQRLDLVLRRHLWDVKTASRTRVQAWIEGGQVAVNARPVRRASARAAAGDVITVVLPEGTDRAVMVGEELPLDVFYEDDYLVAVNKPAGVVVHPTYRHAGGTVMNALLWRARTWPDGQRPSLVGRLDKGTSGILVVAKTAAVHAALQRTLRSDRSEKDYLAVVYGRVNVSRGEIGLRLSRDPGDRRRVVASANTGVPSLTEFERLSRVAAPRAGLSLLRCRLRTGRTHQIRVHLAARGWPIVGDPTYGTPRWTDVADPALAAALHAFPRQALHAWRTTFPHPVTLQRVDIEAPVPQDLANLLATAALGPSNR